MSRKRSSSLGCGCAVLILFLVLLLGAAGCAGVLYAEVNGLFRPEGYVEVHIPQGASTAVVAAELQKAGAVGSASVFRLYSRYFASGGMFQYGTFSVDRKSNYQEIIRVLQTPVARKEDITLSFPEGLNAFQYGEILEKSGLCTSDEFIEAINTHTFNVSFADEISDNPLKLVRYEGFLFPDTYTFYKDATPDDIITIMLRNYEKRVLTEETLDRIKELGYTLDQLASLSAIVQRESIGTEWGKVASVFTNRLKPGSPYPRLESDTTGHFINDYLRPRISHPSQEQLLFYDSYAVEGIPEGCIANAGLDAIHATLYPEETDYYFFVTDIEYNHYYGRTWQEHQANISKALAVNKKHGKNTVAV